METSTWWEFLWFQYHSCLKRQHWVNCWWMWTVILTILYLSLLYGTDFYIQVGTSWLMASLPEPNLAAIANKSNLSFSHTSESIPNWVLRIPCVTVSTENRHTCSITQFQFVLRSPAHRVCLEMTGIQWKWDVTGMCYVFHGAYFQMNRWHSGLLELCNFRNC